MHRLSGRLSYDSTCVRKLEALGFRANWFGYYYYKKIITYGMKYLSIEVSAPVFNRVVIARVAMDRFESEISISKSILHAETALG